MATPTHARTWVCVALLALPATLGAAAEVQPETMRLIDDLRVSVQLRPLAPTRRGERARGPRAVASGEKRNGPLAAVRRLFGRLRWVMTVVITVRLLLRTLDRFLPIPEDDYTDALDYVDFEKFLYDDVPTHFPGEVVKLPST
ncbi:hypothetical protein T492DRAFT_1027120 [Pavlovales sp. CCMP2436]|nr:hypothetical protein T492DRAFT_1027120 [Pavlovales sp. CCMP2436]|mmetsp:Transcript_26666/g.62384  ORF Transcript_26666/g.62384 Transcript_26666/m.62384 type:complete len:143 (+) Transcript_26666:170-598(+)